MSKLASIVLGTVIAFMSGSCLWITGSSVVDDSISTRSDKPVDVSNSDNAFCRIDRRFPGFAGVVKKGDRLVLSFAKRPPRNLNQVTAALRRAPFSISGHPEVRRVRYGWCRLKEWYDHLASRALSLDGVVMSDIDESRNEIHIGVVDLERWEPEVRAIASRLGVPQRVLRVSRQSPLTPADL